MIDLCYGFIVIAFCDSIVYFDISEHLDNQEENGSMIEIEESKVLTIELQDHKKIGSLQVITPADSCLVIEDTRNSHISFVTFRISNEADGTKKMSLF